MTYSQYRSRRRAVKMTVIIALLVIIGVLAWIPASFAATASPPGVANFPASYQPALKTLQAKYPNWKFVALNTGLDWQTVINNETTPYPNNKSLVPTSFEPAMKDTSYTGQIEPGWVRASSGAVKYYMDPRNWLDEKSIFQFELLSYDSATHKLAGVQSIVGGTFMVNASNTPYITYTNTSGGTSTITKSYPQAIFDAGVANKVSPYYLAAKIRQEVVLGGGAASDSVTGKVSGYTGIYNFYNIGATAGANPVVNGLAWAKNSANGYQTPWTDPVKSISGGANWIAKGYINVGQDTIYLQKYNVAPSDKSQLYWHQYMTNVAGAASEGEKLYNGYAAIGVLPQAKVFYIPVYTNMPATQCYRPSGFPDSATDLYILNTSGVNIRTGPGTGYATYGQFPEGTTVKVRNLYYASANGYTWAQVELANGSVGYIANIYLTKRASNLPETGYEDSDSRIVYTGSWGVDNGSVYSGGSAHYTQAYDGRAYIKFDGSGIKFYGAKLPWGGRAHVWIDGVYKGTIDTYSATATRKVLLYEIGGLAKGKTHELMLVNTNLSYAPKPATFVVDRFVVVDGKILDGAGPGPVYPENVYENTNTKIAYTGAWGVDYGSVYFGDSAHYTQAYDGRAYIKFDGSGIKFYGAKLPWGGRAHVWIDGVYKGTIDTYSATATRKVLLYEIGGLAKGKTHELMLVNTNLSYAPKPATFVVDRFVVVDGKILDGAGPAKAAPLSAPVPSMAPLLEVPDDDMPDISNEETSAQ